MHHSGDVFGESKTAVTFCERSYIDFANCHVDGDNYDIIERRDTTFSVVMDLQKF